MAGGISPGSGETSRNGIILREDTGFVGRQWAWACESRLQVWSQTCGRNGVSQGGDSSGAGSCFARGQLQAVFSKSAQEGSNALNVEGAGAVERDHVVQVHANCVYIGDDAPY